MNKHKIIVQKFGGTSVATPKGRQQVLNHMKNALEEGYRLVTVVSAMGRKGDPYATDTLLDLLRKEGTPIFDRDYDFIFQTGEIISVAVISHLAKLNGISSIGLTGAQAGIITNGKYRRAKIIRIDTKHLLEYLDQGNVPIVTGGQGISETGNVNILGRGASDLSGVALGVALNADKVEIFSDVSGVALADPRIIPDTAFMSKISYKMMYEMALYGAKVIHPEAVLWGEKGKVPIICRSTFNNEPGTMIFDVNNVKPISGIPSLGPVELFIIRKDIINDVEIKEIYEKFGALSLSDEENIILVINPRWCYELKNYLLSKNIGSIKTLSEQCIISLIGTKEFIDKSHQQAESIVSKYKENYYKEKKDIRITFTIPCVHASNIVDYMYQSFINNIDNL